MHEKTRYLTLVSAWGFRYDPLTCILTPKVSVIEYARNVLGWTEATSEEFDEEGLNLSPTEKKKRHAVVFMPEISKTVMGGTMRLGARGTLVVVRPAICEAQIFLGFYWQTSSLVQVHLALRGSY